MKEITETELLECARTAAEAAGRHAAENRSRRTETTRRVRNDVKLVLDVECQRVAEAIIHGAFPDHAILGEEGERPRAGADYEWIVDPIDGTVNFSHGLPVWCSSVAVRRGPEVMAGAVFAPDLGDLYTATRGGPALRNGEPIRVSDIADPAEAVMATGLAAKTGDRITSYGVFRALTLQLQRVRIMGASAVDICHVAAGRIEGYVETSIYLWDVAAAGLIARRAGGRTEILEELGGHRMRFLATNGHIHDAVRAVIVETLARRRMRRPRRAAEPRRITP